MFGALGAGAGVLVLVRRDGEEVGIWLKGETGQAGLLGLGLGVGA